MNMKYFKLKYILSGILIIVLAVAIILFFVGTLTPSTVEYNNISFNKEGFVNPQTELENNANFKLNKQKVVADNEKYALLFNEETTILTLLEKDARWNKTSRPTSGKVLYTTADTSSSSTASNLIVKYFGTTNKEGTFDSYTYSVNFEDKTQKDEKGNSKKFKYYQYRYLPEENAVDIYYTIGRHTTLYSRFPFQFDRTAFEDLFIGNVIFNTQTDENIKKNNTLTFTDENGETIKGKEIKYLDSGYAFTEEAAKYLEENGLATVTPYTIKIDDENGGKKEVVAYYLLSNTTNGDGSLKAQMGVHYNCADSPVQINPFIPGYKFTDIISSNGGYELPEGAEGKKFTSSNWLERVEGASPTLNFVASTPVKYQELQEFLYGGADFKTSSATVTNPDGSKENVKYTIYYDYNGDGEITEDEKYVYGGYHATDEDGNYLYDENGRPVQSVMTKELVDQQNDLFENTDLAKTIKFDVCLRVTLTDTGIDARILNESLDESEAFLSSISVFPYMTVNKDSESVGQIVIPDGSGAVISFNSVKHEQQPTKYLEKRLYGSDLTIPVMEQGLFSKDIMLNMYGFLEQSDKKGLVVIADQGAAQVSFEADFMRPGKEGVYNEARFTAYFREKETVQITSTTAFTKLSKDIYPEDIIFKYEVLTGDNLTYVDVAETYRNYLLNKYELLTEDGDKTTTNNLSVNFLGAFTKKQIALGFVYDAEMSLTTFEQASQIVDELKNNGVSAMNVSYSFWTEDEMRPELTTDVSVSKELGGKKGLKELTAHLKELGVPFYPEYNAVTGSGYDMNFGVMKYSSKSISGSYSELPSFVLSTGQANAEIGSQNLISPRFYKALVSKYTDNVTKLEIDGLLLSNLGNERTADYAKKVQIYSGVSTKYQAEAIKEAKSNLNGVMLSSPFDYALQYASYAVNVPTSATLYPIIDYSIPLYQLVVSGLLDYSGEYVNYNNDNTAVYNLLKAIETGSNLSFMLSYEDTSVLLDTNHTGYYNSYYSNWSNEIISMNEELNKAKIFESRLVDHKYITDNLVQVKYENGLTILINYDKATYQDPINGVAVKGNWYTIIEKGA